MEIRSFFKAPENKIEIVSDDSNSNMEYKVIVVSYKPRFDYFKVPKDWKLEDIDVTWGQLSYKGDDQEVPKYQGEEDVKYPVEVTERDDMDLSMFYDCE